MEVEKNRASAGTVEVFGANVDKCLYNSDVYCVYLYLRNTCWMERNQTQHLSFSMGQIHKRGCLLD